MIMLKNFGIGENHSRFGSNWNCSSGSCDGVTFRFQSFNDSIDDYSQTVEDIANRAASIIEFSLVDPDSGIVSSS